MGAPAAEDRCAAVSQPRWSQTAEEPSTWGSHLHSSSSPSSFPRVSEVAHVIHHTSHEAVHRKGEHVAMGPYLRPTALHTASLSGHLITDPTRHPGPTSLRGQTRARDAPYFSGLVPGKADRFHRRWGPSAAMVQWRGDPVILSHLYTGLSPLPHRAAVSAHSLGQNYILGTLPSVECK